MEDRLLTDKRVWELVQAENRRQVKKWGVQDRTPAEWLSFTMEEVGEMAKAISEWKYRAGTTIEVVNEAIQSATLCLKIAEMFLAEKK